MLLSALFFKSRTSASLERPSLIATTFNLCALAVAGQSMGIGSAYMFGIGGAWLLMTVLLNEVLPGKNRQGVSLVAYFFGTVC
jgi:hypothetical protein